MALHAAIRWLSARIVEMRVRDAAARRRPGEAV
jgi:hypothetical protein